MADKKKIFVVSGYHHHYAEGNHDIITDVFTSCHDAAQFVFDTLTDTFPNDSDRFSIDCCMYGDKYCNDNEEVNIKIEEFAI